MRGTQKERNRKSVKQAENRKQKQPIKTQRLLSLKQK